MTKDFTLEARTLVDQHYAAGPARLKEVLAEALAEAAGAPGAQDDPRERLEREVAELEKTSERGSE